MKKQEEETFSENEALDRLNSGLAIVMKTILNTNKPKRKKTVVLAKAKKLSTKNAAEASQNSLTECTSRLKTYDWILKGKTKPDPLERNYERRLSKITISGVVSLFNTVNQYKINAEKSDQTLKKRHLKSIDRRKFLGILQDGSVFSDKKNTSNKFTDDKDEKPNASDTWNVLKQDFINKTKWKNQENKTLTVNDVAS